MSEASQVELQGINVATYRILEGLLYKHLQRMVPADPDGVALIGEKPAVASGSITLSADNVALINLMIDALDAIVLALAPTTAPIPTYGPSIQGTATFNRPADATPYAVGDLIAQSTVAGSVVPQSVTVASAAGGKGLIRAAKLSKAGATAASIRVHFFLAAPTVTAGDNGAMAATKTGYLGKIDVDLAAVFSDGAAGVGLGEVPFDLASGTTVYYLLEARSIFTPSSASAYALETTSWPEA